MSSPLETPEFGTLYVGDTKDDDGQVIDSLFIETDTPPKAIIEPIHSPLELPKPSGRLLTGSIVLDSSYTVPIQILPADDKRIQVRVDAYSTADPLTFNDYVLIADENGKAQANTTSAYRLRHGKGHTLDEYTGPLYVLPGAITAAIEVTWVAVTV